MLTRLSTVDRMQQIGASELVRLLQPSLAAQQVDFAHVIERFGQVRASEDRTRGKKFDLRDHVRGLVPSLLSNQRPWHRIETNLELIERIFLSYDSAKIKKADPSQIEKSLCANKVALRKQGVSWLSLCGASAYGGVHLPMDVTANVIGRSGSEWRAQEATKSRRSALTLSFSVVHIPCDAPS
jgi:hypothetical protein